MTRLPTRTRLLVPLALVIIILLTILLLVLVTRVAGLVRTLLVRVIALLLGKVLLLRVLLLSRPRWILFWSSFGRLVLGTRWVRACLVAVAILSQLLLTFAARHRLAWAARSGLMGAVTLRAGA